MRSNNAFLPNLRAIRSLLLLAVVFATVAAAAILLLQSRRARTNDANVMRAFEKRVKDQERFRTVSSDLYKLQMSALNRLDALERRLEPPPLPRCEQLAPTYHYGVGILQVASVPESRGTDAERFAKAQQTRLLTLLGDRKLQRWGMVLTQYRGQENEPIRRVAFNNIDPVAGAKMCAWLRCEKWSGGCAFVDEHGAVHPEAAPAEYPQVEDLFELWKVAEATPSPKRGG